MKYLLFILTVILFTSCGHYSDGTSVYAGKVWILLVLLPLGGLWFIYLAYRASKSNSTQQKTGLSVSTGNVPIYQLGKFWIGVAMIIAAIVVVIVQNAEK